jgi:hypothetical protein
MYGTVRQRLGGDAIKDYDCCSLTLQPCVDPVVTPRELIYIFKSPYFRLKLLLHKLFILSSCVNAVMNSCLATSTTEGVLYEREAIYEHILKEKQRISKVSAAPFNVPVIMLPIHLDCSGKTSPLTAAQTLQPTRRAVSPYPSPLLLRTPSQELKKYAAQQVQPSSQ